MEQEEFEALLCKHDDCPETLVKMANTKWQKAVAIEFVRNDQRMIKIESNVKWIKWLVLSVFGITTLAFLSQYLAPFFSTIFA